MPKIFARDRFKFLEREAEKGSSLAKTMYVMNAFTFSRLYFEMGTNESVKYSSEILLKAEKFGKEDAQDGFEEAHLAISEAYRTGVFG